MVEISIYHECGGRENCRVLGVAVEVVPRVGERLSFWLPDWNFEGIVARVEWTFHVVKEWEARDITVKEPRIFIWVTGNSEEEDAELHKYLAGVEGRANLVLANEIGGPQT